MTWLTRRELALAVLLFAVSLPAVTSRLYASDEVQYYSYLRSLWFDRDVSFDNEYRYFADAGLFQTSGFRETFLERSTATGYRENFATIGAALLWAPFYAVADLATRLLRAAGSPVAADGYSRLYIAAVSYGSAVYAFAALLLSVAAARRLTGHGLRAALAAWLGTPLLFYMYAAPPFAHACSAFAVALFVTLWLRVRQRWSTPGLVALGAAAALMTMVREQDALYAVGVAADFGWFVLARMRSSAAAVAERKISPAVAAASRYLAGAAAGGLTFVLAYSPQLLSYLALNDRLGPSRLVTRKMNWLSPYAAGVVASPSHGLFAWTPLALLALAGLVLLWLHAGAAAREAERVPVAGDVRRVAGCMLLMLALQVYVTGSVESWTVAGAFGQRRFVSATLLLVVGLAAWWQAAPTGLPRAALITVTVLGVWWNVGLMALFGANLMDRQRLTLKQNAYDVFVTLPRTGPSLAYRYLFDRRSFYRSAEPES